MAVATLGACSRSTTAAQPTTSTTSLQPPPPAPSVAPTAAPPPVEPSLSQPSVAPTSRLVLCRDAWGARPPRPGGIAHTPNRLTIHHTAVTLGANSNAPSRLRQHQQYHQDSHGWIDIAYHYSVDRHGNIYELRNPELVGDTATSYDPTGHFLVLCEGNFDEEQVTEEQLNGAALVCAWAAQRYNITTNTLAGHRDASSDTACPGASLYTYVTSGDLQGRVEGLLAAGPVELFTVCGAEAAQAVADIEAGLL